MNDEDKKLLEEAGFTVYCESPFEIGQEGTRAFASGVCADLVVSYLRYLEKKQRRKEEKKRL